MSRSAWNEPTAALVLPCMSDTTKTTLQVLKEARNFLAQPERWIKHAMARVNGTQVSSRQYPLPEAPQACCANGAALHADGWATPRRIKLGDFECGVRSNAREWWTNDAVLSLARALPDAQRPSESNGLDVMGYNDAAGTSHADVLALFDRAIAAEEARAAQATQEVA